MCRSVSVRFRFRYRNDSKFCSGTDPAGSVLAGGHLRTSLYFPHESDRVQPIDSFPCEPLSLVGRPLGVQPQSEFRVRGIGPWHHRGPIVLLLIPAESIEHLGPLSILDVPHEIDLVQQENAFFRHLPHLFVLALDSHPQAKRFRLILAVAFIIDFASSFSRVVFGRKGDRGAAVVSLLVFQQAPIHVLPGSFLGVPHKAYLVEAPDPCRLGRGRYFLNEPFRLEFALRSASEIHGDALHQISIVVVFAFIVEDVLS
mmetsp:Transcript_422/g.963  ORF Transcript_422/g.963 Transcript_422/m.963 type:complete len:257 (-) Transcript_422:28-798(-)